MSWKSSHYLLRFCSVWRYHQQFKIISINILKSFSSIPHLIIHHQNPMSLLRKCIIYSLRDSQPACNPQKMLRTFFDIRTDKSVENIYCHNKKQMMKSEIMKQINSVQKYQQLLFGMKPRSEIVPSNFFKETLAKLKKG